MGVKAHKTQMKRPLTFLINQYVVKYSQVFSLRFQVKYNRRHPIGFFTPLF